MIFFSIGESRPGKAQNLETLPGRMDLNRGLGNKPSQGRGGNNRKLGRKALQNIRGYSSIPSSFD
jgi:hypothetical protein